MFPPHVPHPSWGGNFQGSGIMSVKIRSGLDESNRDRENGYNERSVMKQVRDIISKHSNDDTEHGYAIGLDGKLIPHYDDDGNEVYDSVGVGGHVNIYGAEDAISIHNHPLRMFGVFGGTFSDGDIRSSVNRNEFMSVAFDQNKVYILKRMNWKKGERSDSSLFANNYKTYATKILTQIENSIEQRMMKGEFRKPNGKADINAMDKATTEEWLKKSSEWLRNHSKEYGFSYREYSFRGKKK